jgi:hypothetical protein
MNLEQLVHERWAASAELATLLPAERVFTGSVPTGDLPYATLLRRLSRPKLATNRGPALEEVALRVRVWHESHAAAAAVARAVDALLDGGRFALPGDERVVHFRRRRESACRFADGAWRLTLDFRAQVPYSADSES